MEQDTKCLRGENTARDFFQAVGEIDRRYSGPAGFFAGVEQIVGQLPQLCGQVALADLHRLFRPARQR